MRQGWAEQQFSKRGRVCKAESLEYLPKGCPPHLGSSLPQSGSREVQQGVSQESFFSSGFTHFSFPEHTSTYPSSNHPDEFYVIKSFVGVGLRACWWLCTAGREMPWGRGSVRAPLSLVWWPLRGTRCMTWAPFRIDYEVPKECQH